MTTNSTIDIPKDGYVAFDAMSLRQLIINRLNEQNIFTDQNFIGSNLASVIDIVAYAYHTLIYYLNKTSTESMFSEAQLYENINRIVKIIDYKPIGCQTSTLTFTCSAQNMARGLYTIPRYSFVVANNVAYSFNEDITFAKTLDYTLEDLSELSQQKLLYQGRYKEYPIYTATGNDNETLIMDTANIFVDHFNIDVYVKSVNSAWKLYTKTQNLYLEDGYSEKYEIRLNGNNRYEIKFGNNINGKKLEAGDQIAVYYIASNGIDGEIGPDTLNAGSQVTYLGTPRFNTILADVNKDKDYRYLTQLETTGLILANQSSSTFFQDKEDGDQIRENAPTTYKSQYRLVALEDYEIFIKTNFANLVADIRAVNNTSYVLEYLKYFYDIGLTTPTNTERALFNQIQFADSCNFNNIYLLTIPKSTTTTSLDYLLPAQKLLIESSTRQIKTATTEITFIDPIYKAVTFGLQQNNTIPSSFDAGEVDLYQINIYKSPNSTRGNQAIKNDIVNIFKDYFNKQNMKLGQILDLRFLTQQILNVEGVNYFNTASIIDPTIYTQGLSLFVWNPLYPNNDIIVTQNNVSTQFFEYYFFDNIENIEDKINILTIPNTLLSFNN